MNGNIGPLPSRRVLDELCPSWTGGTTMGDAAASIDLRAALVAHALASIAVDRAEAALIAARASAGAADRGSGRGVGSKRRAFMVRHARQFRLDRRARDLAARLLSIPAAGLDDIALKLAVVIAASEAGPPDAAAFPWSRLRLILAELLAIATAGT